MKKRIWHALFLIAISLLLVSTGEKAIGETDSIRDAREKRQDASNRRADAAAILKLAEADDAAPDSFNGIEQLEVAGTSFAYLLNSETEPTRKKVQYFEMFCGFISRP